MIRARPSSAAEYGHAVPATPVDQPSRRIELHLLGRRDLAVPNQHFLILSAQIATLDRAVRIRKHLLACRSRTHAGPINSVTRIIDLDIVGPALETLEYDPRLTAIEFRGDHDGRKTLRDVDAAVRSDIVAVGHVITAPGAIPMARKENCVSILDR
ncbi:hypothetical protein [Burkholderia alba]|uniref:hypothetical protein n=1 Tax=Burkholderia alba TaxID=2683677 RepID=UPI002B05F490|nr:hypothetical protein [Burkholderia alba]